MNATTQPSNKTPQIVIIAASPLMLTLPQNANAEQIPIEDKSEIRIANHQTIKHGNLKFKVLKCYDYKTQDCLAIKPKT